MNEQEIIRAYADDNKSMNAIAREFHTYPTTIKRILEKHDVELRHDAAIKGAVVVRDGEKLIEWAKAQDRLVTKTELAQVLGKKKLSPSYFIKYPELGKYISRRSQKDIQGYTKLLYQWLDKNNISYKPNDRTQLQVSVDALLLGDYTGLAIQIQEKAKCVSSRNYEKRMKTILHRANDAGIRVIFLNKEHFGDLDSIKPLLDRFKK